MYVSQDTPSLPESPERTMTGSDQVRSRVAGLRPPITERALVLTRWRAGADVLYSGLVIISSLQYCAMLAKG